MSLLFAQVINDNVELQRRGSERRRERERERGERERGKREEEENTHTPRACAHTLTHTNEHTNTHLLYGSLGGSCVLHFMM